MLDVIGAGFGRTGTLSLKAALERLGFGPCYHAIEIMRHADHIARWEAVLAGQPDWERVFEGYRSSVDWPAVGYWRELTDAYPDAKVVLTVRDPRGWYTSVRDTFLAESGPEGAPPFLADLDMPPAGVERLGRLMGQMMAQGPDFRDEHAAIDAFTRHNDDVSSAVPADRLLVYEVAQGWEPLCDFLGVPVPPGEPFPRLNDRDSFKDLIPKLVSGDEAQTPN
jgi:Sulfotransferase domain